MESVRRDVGFGSIGNDNTKVADRPAAAHLMLALVRVVWSGRVPMLERQPFGVYGIASEPGLLHNGPLTRPACSKRNGGG